MANQKAYNMFLVLSLVANLKNNSGIQEKTNETAQPILYYPKFQGVSTCEQ